MTYRNFTPRCHHGFAIGIVRCPVCDEPHTGYSRHYIPSEHKHGVISKRGHGPARSHRAHGYTSEMPRTNRG